MDYYITDQAWHAISSHLKSLKKIHTKNEENLRQFIEGVWYVARSGSQWRLLPKTYGHWRAVHRRFKRWCDAGIWANLFEHVKDEDMEVVMLDSTIVRAHACAAGYRKDSEKEEALGRSKGGFTTKIHALVDALGNPLKFILTPGQRHEVTQAEDLLSGISYSKVLADKGYDAKFLMESLLEKSCSVCIPSRANRKNKSSYDKYLYKERHLIECFFGKIKHYRRIFSRFDKSSKVFMGFLNFVGTLIWLR